MVRSSFSRVRLPRIRALVAGGCACLLAVWADPRAPQAQTFQTAASQAILYDTGSESVLFERNADEPMAPASMAKLMTAAVVFEEMRQGRLKLEDEMIVSEGAWRRGGAVAGGSSMFALPNSRIKVSDLLQGMIVQSGNDAAIALAEGIAGSEDNFVNLMNARAAALGLRSSTFRNASGLDDPAQKTTARELAQLAHHLIATYPEQYPVFGQREFTWNRVRQQNRNPLLAMDIGADGLKTGQTEASGFGLVGSAVQNGQRLIVVVNGLKTARDRAIEARKLLDWGFRSFEPRQVFAAGEALAELPVFGGARASVPVHARQPVNLLVPRGESDLMRGRIVFSGPLLAPVAEGQEVGRLYIERGDIQALDVPVYAAEAVPAGELSQRAQAALFELATGWIRRLLPQRAANAAN